MDKTYFMHFGDGSEGYGDDILYELTNYARLRGTNFSIKEAYRLRAYRRI